MEKLPKSVETSLQQLAADSLTGASGCLLAALDCLELFAQEAVDCDPPQLQAMCKQLAGRLAGAKPPMVAIAAVTNRCVQSAVRESDPLRALREACRHERTILKAASEQISGRVSDLLQPGCRVMTISHSATVEKALLMAHRSKEISVSVIESRPRCEGTRLAKQLVGQGVPVTLGVDGAALRLLADCQVVLVGADAIANPWFVNKIGTLALVLGARDLGLPFYVAADSSKRISEAMPWEEGRSGPKDEVLHPTPTGMDIANPYFEKVPLSLVSEVLSEPSIHSVG